MKHKHAELIKSWADGAEIEYKNNVTGIWIPQNNPDWYEYGEYRIKPQPYLKPFKEVPLCGGYILRFHKSDVGWMCGISDAMMAAIEEAYR